MRISAESAPGYWQNAVPHVLISHADTTETTKSADMADTADATNTADRRRTPRIERKQKSRGALGGVEIGSVLLSSMKLARSYATAASEGFSLIMSRTGTACKGWLGTIKLGKNKRGSDGNNKISGYSGCHEYAE